MQRKLLRLFILPVVLIFIALGAEAAEEEGSWTARIQRDGVNINMHDERGSNFGSTYGFNELQGLSPSAQGDVAFQLQSEPGTFHFTGKLKGGHGGGIYTFNPNPQFIADMKSLGYELSPKNVRLLAKVGFRTSYIREWKSFGYSNLTLDEVLEMAIHDVTPEYIRALASRGHKSLSRDRVVEMRIHDITPEYIDALKRAGYADLTSKQLVEFSIADVRPEKIAEYKKLGYSQIAPKELYQMSIHDVDPEFISELKKIGYSNLPIKQLVQFSIHDVTAEFIRELEREGFRSISPEDLVRMRIHDVDANFIRRARKDRAQFTVQDLIRMRIHED